MQLGVWDKLPGYKVEFGKVLFLYPKQKRKSATERAWWIALLRDFRKYVKHAHVCEHVTVRLAFPCLKNSPLVYHIPALSVTIHQLQVYGLGLCVGFRKWQSTNHKRPKPQWLDMSEKRWYVDVYVGCYGERGPTLHFWNHRRHMVSTLGCQFQLACYSVRQESLLHIYTLLVYAVQSTMMFV